MRGVMAADTHLGFRAYARTENGRNAREQDVERAWSRLVDLVVEQQPDFFSISGDVFHTVRPSLHAVKAYRDGLRRISEETSADVVVIPGNHDCPKTAETLSPCVIPDDLPRVHVVTSAQWLELDLANGERAAVLCVPHDNLGAAATFDPALAPAADVRVLVIHAAVKTSAIDNALPRFYAGELAVDVGMLAEQFDVVAAGDYHEVTRLHPTRTAFYPGSIERTSSNIWDEKHPKGVVCYDTATGTAEFREIPTRPMHTYEMSEGFESTVEGVNRALELIADTEHEGAIVRLVVEDFPRDDYSLIDRKLTARLRETCFAFDLTVRFAERDARALARAGSSLFEEAERFFAQDPETVKATALTYLRGAA